MALVNAFTNDNRELLQLFVAAMAGNAEVSLRQMFDIARCPDGLPYLTKVGAVSDLISQFGFELLPDLNKGDLDTVRRMKTRVPSYLTEEQSGVEISKGEGSRLELKSSLLYDHKRAQSCPDTAISQLRSEAVLHSTLKTIGGFLNTQGGVLYIGINDNGNQIGIEHDLLFLPENKRNRDNWELMFRGLVKSHFKDGESINDYLEVVFSGPAPKDIPRIAVARRRSLSFLKRNEGFALYRRQGNRTIEVTIDQVEEFLQVRNQ